MKAMSWSEDKRCLYCGSKLPLHRKVVDEQFCSDSHRKSFRIEQNQLALQRLSENYAALNPASRSASSLEHRQGGDSWDDDSRFGAAIATLPREAPYETPAQNRSGRNLDLGPDFEVTPDYPLRPEPSALLAALSAASIGAPISAPLGHKTVFVEQGALAPELSEVVYPSAPPSFVHLTPKLTYLESDELYLNLCPFSVGGPPTWERDGKAQPLAPARTAVPKAWSQQVYIRAGKPEPEESVWSIVVPVLCWDLSASTVGEDSAPSVATTGSPAVVGSLDPPLAAPVSQANPLPRNLPNASPRGSLAPLPPAECELALLLENEGLATGEPPLGRPIQARLQAGSNNAAPNTKPASCWDGAFAAFSSAVAIATLREQPAAGSATGKLLPLRFRVDPGGRLPKPVDSKAVEPGDFASSVSEPRLRLRTVWSETEKNRLLGALAFWMGARGSGAANPIRLSVDFWQNAPRDLKLLAVAIPILLALALHPSLPKIHFGSSSGSASKPPIATAVPVVVNNVVANNVVANNVVVNNVEVATTQRVAAKPVPIAINPLSSDAPRTLSTPLPEAVAAAKQSDQPGAKQDPKQDPKQDWTTDLKARFAVLRQTVAERAGVELTEDFRKGLDEWQTQGDLSTSWSFDETGFVRPTALALYHPSLGLRDYDFQFLGLIDKKALSWAVRAQDFSNYYAVKLTITKPGPLPTLAIERYPVVNGKAGKHVLTQVRINAMADALFRVGMNIHDDTFLLTVQGNVIDTWSDADLKRGGVGFFSATGEASRLRWVQVSHQYDMLGRLCAYLAPYN